MDCKTCEYWNKKKVLSPSKHGFCECTDNKEKYQMVLPEHDTCSFHRIKRSAKTTILNS